MGQYKETLVNKKIEKSIVIKINFFSPVLIVSIFYKKKF